MKPRIIMTILLLIGLGAVVHGNITQRWSMFEPDKAKTARIHAVVVQYPGLTSEIIPHDVELKERSIATSRRYMLGENFLAMTSVISGVPGAVSTHTPDVCYTSSGYRMTRGPLRETLSLKDGTKAECFVADFAKSSATGSERLRVRWCWHAGNGWVAPDFARFSLMRVAELYKFYVVTPLAEDQKDDPETVRRFLAEALASHARALESQP